MDAKRVFTAESPLGARGLVGGGRTDFLIHSPQKRTSRSFGRDVLAWLRLSGLRDYSLLLRVNNEFSFFSFDAVHRLVTIELLHSERVDEFANCVSEFDGADVAMVCKVFNHN